MAMVPLTVTARKLAAHFANARRSRLNVLRGERRKLACGDFDSERRLKSQRGGKNVFFLG